MNINKVPFVLMGLMALLLAAATVVERLLGTGAARAFIYTSPPTILLWTLICVLGGALLWRARRALPCPALLLHAAFVVILAGALLSHLTARQGRLHLRVGEAPAFLFVTEAGEVQPLPLGVALDRFELRSYGGTPTPMDYASHLTFTDGSSAEVSMNHIASRAGYRFYQHAFDADRLGATLLVTFDPWGIAVSYAGYGLLLFAWLALFWAKRSRWRVLLRQVMRGAALTVLLVAASTVSAAAASSPVAEQTLPTVSPRVAREMERLYVYHNGRICPLATLADELTRKCSGSNSYRHLTAMQVIAGWLFYYDVWRDEPFVKTQQGCRPLAMLMRSSRADDISELSASELRRQTEIDERTTLLEQLAAGELLRIYPITDGASLQWLSPVDKLPPSLSVEEWTFIRKSLNLLAQYVAEGDEAEAVKLLRQMRRYQQKRADAFGANLLPSEPRFEAELLYLRLPSLRLIGVALLLMSLAGLLLSYRLYRLLPLAALLYLSLLLGLRWYIGGHVPVASGYEAMLLLAWLAALGGALIAWRSGGANMNGMVSREGRGISQTALRGGIAVSLLTAALASLVASMGAGNPQITPLVPVLASPLLSLHVVVIMMAYALLAITFFCGLAGLTLLIAGRRGRIVDAAARADCLQTVSRLALTPAVALLSIGIFIGAVWANQSWGSYWSWDPKETWALITMLLYALPLHATLSRFRRPAFFHAYIVVAFLAVLITYFGVNFVLGGMHSYN